MNDLKTNVYIDGFNLYYGLLKNSRYKWLNLKLLCEKMFPKNHIQTINYFIAQVSGTQNDPGQPDRQQAYFRALNTLENFNIIYGKFVVRKKKMSIADIFPLQWVWVNKIEEKMTDVNMTTRILCDAFEGNFDIAIIVTNDSDFKEPLRILKYKLGKKVLLVNPSRRAFADDLVKNSHWVGRIKKEGLKNCQFPLKLKDAKGVIYRPPAW
jgi:uncharacterized LabA/DUF88 family protein